MRMMAAAQPLRPAQYVEKYLATSILDGTYPPGSVLPNERRLAKELGITRPTLRETLQRLAAEGWLEIRHGKPTVIKNYWQEGGLSLLGTLARYGNHLPDGLVTHLLEVRLTVLPAVAVRAATHHPDAVLEYLSKARNLAEDAGVYSDYDWNLKILMARNSRNPLYSLILNDFASVYKAMAMPYFSVETARLASRAYYQKLADAIKIRNASGVEAVVKKAMAQSIAIWQAIRAQAGRNKEAH